MIASSSSGATSIRAGNLYINRTTVGAIVLRQPFGGMGKSAFGPGVKAGGPNYAALLLDFEDAAPAAGSPMAVPTLADPLLAGLCEVLGEVSDGEARHDQQRALAIAAVASYSQSFREEFGQSHDHFKLIGQDNLRRYVPVRELRVRIDPQDTPWEVVARLAAARIAGCRTTVCSPPACHTSLLRRLEALTEPWAGDFEFVEESDADLAVIIGDGQTDRIRFAAPDRVPLVLRQAAAKTGVYLAAAPVSREGRLELLWYVREQSISYDYHRYGNLGVRESEPRAAVL